MNHRIIARLDIKGPNLVKGVHLEGLRVLGKPDFFAEYYSSCGADELMYNDVVASLYGRNSLHSIITKTAKEINIPLTVGGGLRTIEDIRAALRAGADKVSLNTMAVKDPSLVEKAAKIFGSSTIVVSIEALRQPNGSYLAYTDNGREYTGLEVVKWAKQVEEMGAGEIVITSIDQEGSGKGFDLELNQMISEAASIPVIAHGGAGHLKHTSEVFEKTECDAIAIASVLHYGCIKQNIEVYDFEEEGNIAFVLSGAKLKNIQSLDISMIKKDLIKKGFHCRYREE